MALQNFVDKVGPVISAAWLNAVDVLKFTIFDDATTKALARTALTFDAPLEIVNGGTGNRGSGATFLTFLASFFPFIWQYIYPRTASEIAQSVTPVDYSYPPYHTGRYGVVMDSGGTNNNTQLANWIKAIPVDGTGYISQSENGGYAQYTTGITRTTRCSILGFGQASRLNYTGTGVAMTFNEARFCTFGRFYITGTASGLGGIYFRNGQECLSMFELYVDSFTTGYAVRFSDSWDITIEAGGLRQSATGVLCDATNLGQGGVNNVVNIHSVDLSFNTLGIDYQSGNSANFTGNDFSDCTVAIEIGRAQAGTKFVGAVNVTDGNWFEGTGAGVRVGRGNTSSNTPRDVWIQGNYFGNLGDQIRFYVGTRLGWGRNQWGSGACIIDAGVTQTYVGDRGVTITDGSTVGQTTTIAYDTINIPDITMRGSTSFSGTLSPAAIAANTNNYNPAGLSTANVLILNATGPFNITGMVPPRSFCYLIVINISASTLTFTHEDGASTAANRFVLSGGANMALARTGGIVLYYDQSTSRWYAMRT